MDGASRARKMYCSSHTNRRSWRVSSAVAMVRRACARIGACIARLGMEERVKGGWLQKKLAKILKRPLPKEVADALFTYEGFLHDRTHESQYMIPLSSQSVLVRNQ